MFLPWISLYSQVWLFTKLKSTYDDGTSYDDALYDDGSNDDGKSNYDGYDALYDDESNDGNDSNESNWYDGNATEITEQIKINFFFL